MRAVLALFRGETMFAPTTDTDTSSFGRNADRCGERVGRGGNGGRGGARGEPQGNRPTARCHLLTVATGRRLTARQPLRRIFFTAVNERFSLLTGGTR
jgi:hypothetical protein